MGAGPANILFGSEVNIWINRADIRQQIYGAPLLFCAGSHALHITSQRSVIAQIFTRTSHGRYQGAHAVRAGLVCKSHPDWEGEKEISEKKEPKEWGAPTAGRVILKQNSSLQACSKHVTRFYSVFFKTLLLVQTFFSAFTGTKMHRDKW